MVLAPGRTAHIKLHEGRGPKWLKWLNFKGYSEKIVENTKKMSII